MIFSNDSILPSCYVSNTVCTEYTPTYQHRDTFFAQFEYFFMTPPLNQWHMMSTWHPLKKIIINPFNESLRAYFHFYITNKRRNEIVCYINSLDSSDGRAIGYDPQGQGFNPPLG